MEKIKESDIFFLLQELPDSEKIEVFDFAKFLMARKKRKRKKETYKKLLNISLWNDLDISHIEEARKEVNSWNIKKF